MLRLKYVKLKQPLSNGIASNLLSNRGIWTILYEKSKTKGLPSFLAENEKLMRNWIPKNNKSQIMLATP